MTAMAGDKVEQKPQGLVDKVESGLSELAIDLLKGFNQVSKFVKDHPAVDIATGAGIGAAVGAAVGNPLIGAAVGGAGAMAGDAAIKLAEDHKKDIVGAVLFPELTLAE